MHARWPLMLTLALPSCEGAQEWWGERKQGEPISEADARNEVRSFGSPIGEKSHQIDCDPMHGFVVGSTWYAIYDGPERKFDRQADCPPEFLTESWVERLDPEAQDEATGALLHGPGCRVRWTGSVTDFDAASYAAVSLMATVPDLEEYESVLVKTRGDGRVYRVKFPQRAQLEAIPEEEDCETDYYDFYGIDVACGDGTDEWVTREIPFSSLEQEGWGKTFDLDLSEVTELQFFTRERPIHEFQCDLSVAGLRK